MRKNCKYLKVVNKLDTAAYGNSADSAGVDRIESCRKVVGATNATCKDCKFFESKTEK